MLNNKESRNMETKIENVLPFAKRQTLLRMIKKAKYVYAWVVLGDDGRYIQIVKSNLLLVLKDSEYDKDKFVMRGEDLYVN